MDRVKFRSVAVLLVAAVLLSVTAACSGGHSDSRKATDQARAFLRDWSDGKLARAAAMTDDPGPAQAAMEKVSQSLGAQKVDFDAGKATMDGSRARVTVTAHWTVAGLLNPWTYANSLNLTKHSDSWQIHWTPADIHPQLKPGESIEADRPGWLYITTDSGSFAGRCNGRVAT